MRDATSRTTPMSFLSPVAILLRGRLVHLSTKLPAPSKPIRILYGCISLPVQMTTGLMRRFSTSARTQFSPHAGRALAAPRLLGLRQYQRNITDVRPRQASISRNWFTSSSPYRTQELDEEEKKRLAERNLKLGNSMRIAHIMSGRCLLTLLQQ